MESVTEDDIIEAINLREQLIERCKKIVELSNNNKSNMNGITARELVNLAKELRLSGLRCVQRIIAWTLINTDSNSLYPTVFLWNNTEYLCKMLNDLDFISESLNSSFKQYGGFGLNDPFFTKHPGDAAFKRASATATLIVIDAVERRKKLEEQQLLDNINNNNNNMNNDNQSINSNLSQSHDDGSPTPLPKEFRKQRRTGINDLYKTGHADDIAESRVSSRSVVTRSKSVEVSVVFRARKLYHRGKKLGTGSYATVYECERQDGMRFAVKVFNITANPPTSGSEDDDVLYARRCYQRELEFLRTLSHPNIITFEDSTLREGFPYVIIEKMSCTLLEVQMDRITQAPFGQLSPIEINARIVSSQLLDGLTYLHSQHIIHRDIKPENILVNLSARGIVAKFGDFGSAVRLPNKLSGGESFLGESDLTHYVGSRWYRAPETIGSGTDYSYPSDIWSLGCTLGEFICNEALFQGETEQDVLDSIISFFPDNQIPTGMHNYFAERGLTISLGRPKRSIHIVLSRVSSAFRRIIDSMIRLTEDERYNASGLLSDVKELMIEV